MSYYANDNLDDYRIPLREKLRMKWRKHRSKGDPEAIDTLPCLHFATSDVAESKNTPPSFIVFVDHLLFKKTESTSIGGHAFYKRALKPMGFAMLTLLAYIGGLFISAGICYFDGIIAMEFVGDIVAVISLVVGIVILIAVGGIGFISHWQRVFFRRGVKSREKEERRKSRTYKVDDWTFYCDIVRTMQKIFAFIPSYGQWNMAQWIDGNIDEVMSSMTFGSWNRTLPRSVEEVDTAEQRDEIIEARKSYLAEMNDIFDVWQARSGIGELRLQIREKHPIDDAKQMAEIGKALGVDSLVESYYAGVPIDDLKA